MNLCGHRGIGRFGLAMLVAFAIFAGWARALILVGRGNDPVRDDDWPAGSVDVANLKTRVGWWEGPPFGGGQHQFLYRGDEKALQGAIDLFAKIKSPKLRLVVQEGPQENQFLKDPKDAKSDTRVDWAFTVWNAERWNQLYGGGKKGIALADDPNFGKPMDPPTLDVYVTPGRIDWSKVKVPAGIEVTDERASSAGIVGSMLRGKVYDLTTSKPIEGARVVLARNVPGEKTQELTSGTSVSDGHYEAKNVPPGNYTVSAEARGYAPRLIGYARFGKDTLRELPAALAPAASISGTVTDTGGKPIKGATVRTGSVVSADGRGYTNPHPPAAITDDQGRFELTDIARGTALLYVYDEHHQQLDVLKKYAVPGRDVALRLTETGGVMGNVVAPDGRPVGGWRISISINPVGEQLGKWGGSTSVNPDGSFMFDNVPPGEYIVSTKPQLPGVPPDPDAKKIQVKAGKTVTVQVTSREK